MSQKYSLRLHRPKRFKSGLQTAQHTCTRAWDHNEHSNWVCWVPRNSKDRSPKTYIWLCFSILRLPLRSCPATNKTCQAYVERHLETILVCWRCMLLTYCNLETIGANIPTMPQFPAPNKTLKTIFNEQQHSRAPPSKAIWLASF